VALEPLRQAEGDLVQPAVGENIAEVSLHAGILDGRRSGVQDTVEQPDRHHNDALARRHELRRQLPAMGIDRHGLAVEGRGIGPAGDGCHGHVVGAQLPRFLLQGVRQIGAG